MAPGETILISIRDVQTSNLKRLHIKKDSTIDKLRTEIMSLFGIQELGSLMFCGREVRSGTLESCNVHEGSLIEIVGQVQGS